MATGVLEASGACGRGPAGCRLRRGFKNKAVQAAYPRPPNPIFPPRGLHTFGLNDCLLRNRLGIGRVPPPATLLKPSLLDLVQGVLQESSTVRLESRINNPGFELPPCRFEPVFPALHLTIIKHRTEHHFPAGGREYAGWVRSPLRRHRHLGRPPDGGGGGGRCPRPYIQWMLLAAKLARRESSHQCASHNQHRPTPNHLITGSEAKSSLMSSPPMHSA